MLDVIRFAGGLLGLSAFIPLLVFVALYSRSNWRETDLGVSTMLQKIALAAMVLVLTVGALLPEGWRLLYHFLRAGSLLAVVTLLWLDVANLRRYQRLPK